MTIHKLYKPSGPAIWTRAGGWEPVRPGNYHHPIQQAARNQRRMEETTKKALSKPKGQKGA